MRHTMLVFILTILSSCGHSPEKKFPTTQIFRDSTKDISTIKPLDLILGERINGPANIRDSVNGEAIFTLYDKTQVECTEQQIVGMR
jgi:hypothetical protein